MAGVASAAAAWPTTSSAARVMPSPLTHRNLVNRVDRRNSVRSPAMKRALLIPATAALLAGCGSGDDGKSARTAYINKVDAICAQTNADLQETNTRLDELARSARNVSEFEDDLRDGNQIARDELADIRAVPVPEGAQDEMRTVLAARSRQLAAIDRLIQASHENDDAAFKAASDQVQSEKKTAQGEADKFGFKICGQDQGPTAR